MLLAKGVDERLKVLDVYEVKVQGLGSFLGFIMAQG